jgi:hypothetical protein
VNWAAAVNGGVVSSISPYKSGTSWYGSSWSNGSAINDGDRVNASNYAYGSHPMGQYNCAYTLPNCTSNCNFPWLPAVTVTFKSGGVVVNHNIDEIDIFQLQDSNRTTPTPGMTFSSWGANTYHVQYCPAGSSCNASGTSGGWVEVDGVAASGAYSADYAWNHVWNKVSFPPVSANAVRVTFECTDSPTPYFAELEAWDRSAVGVNWAAAAKGATASASSIYGEYPGFAPSAAIDGDRSAEAYNETWSSKGSAWVSASYPVTPTSPAILASTFGGNASISEVDLFWLQDAYTNPVVPVLSAHGSTAGSLYLAQGFTVQYCPAGTPCSSATDTSAWLNNTYTGWTTLGTYGGNFLIWDQLTFPAVPASAVRVVVTQANYMAYVAEMEAWDFTSGQGTFSADSGTAVSLRRDMGGESSCGSLASTTIDGVAGYQEKCSSNFVVWSPNNGAWFLPAPSYFAANYLGGTTWPGATTPRMSQLGYPVGPFYGQDTANEYQPFQNGILATMAGRADPHVIGGIGQCPPPACVTTAAGAGCSCAAADHNRTLSNLWLQQTQTANYPIDDTYEFSLGYTPSPGSACGPSAFGNRGWRFDTANNGTVVTKDASAGAAYLIGPNMYPVWSNPPARPGSGRNSCDTLVALGWPVGNEQAYTENGLGASHQEFEGGSMKWEPQSCTSGPNVATIKLQGSPTTVQSLSALTCSNPTISNACVNGPTIALSSSPPKDQFFSNYYWHCPGSEAAGPGVNSGVQNAALSGITVTIGPVGCQYIVDNESLQAFLLSAPGCTNPNPLTCDPTSDPSCQGCSISNALNNSPQKPPANQRAGAGAGTVCPSWVFSTNNNGTNTIEFPWSACPAGDCDVSAAPTTFYLQTVGLDGAPSGWSVAATDDAGTYKTDGHYTRAITGVGGVYNCVKATFGVPPQKSPEFCTWLHADAINRRPSRLRLQIDVDPSTGAFPNTTQVFVALHDPSDVDTTSKVSWIDLPSNRLQGGTSNAYDLSLGGVGDIDDITGIVIGSTGQSLCIDKIVLTVDDDGTLNNGDALHPNQLAGASRTLYQQQWASPGACSANANVWSPNQGSVVAVTGNQLRSSPDWQYQHGYWSTVVSSAPGNPFAHFSGLQDDANLKAFIYGNLQNIVQGQGYHFGAPLGVTYSSTGSGYANSCSRPGHQCGDVVGEETTQPGVSLNDGGGNGAPQNDVVSANIRLDSLPGRVGTAPSVNLQFGLQIVTHCSSSGNPNNFCAEIQPYGISAGPDNLIDDIQAWANGIAFGQAPPSIAALPIVGVSQLSPEAGGKGNLAILSFCPNVGSSGCHGGMGLQLTVDSGFCTHFDDDSAF